MLKLIAAIIFIYLFLPLSTTAKPKAKSREYFELRVYHIATKQQEATVDGYLQNALLPGLHNKGIKRVGVFKALANDTAAGQESLCFDPA